MDKFDQWLGLTSKPFDPCSTKYDQSTFYGRFRHFLDLIKPTSLFYSRSYCEYARKTIENYDGNSDLSDEELWRLKWLSDSVYHPDTKQPIPLLFRLSFLVPATTPIGIGILLSPKTSFTIPFWHIVNQTYMVCFNYMNRSIKASYSNTQLAFSYIAATVSSVYIALKLDSYLIKKSPLMRTFGPAAAITVSGVLNLIIIRHQEAIDGVQVYDSQGKVLGISKIAALDGFVKTNGLRGLISFSSAYFAVISELTVRYVGLFPVHPVYQALMRTFLLTSTSYIRIPFLCAFYPQMLCKDKLEPHLSTPDKFYYNRGL